MNDEISRKRKSSSSILISWLTSCNDNLVVDMTLTSHKTQVHCSGNMRWWACSSLDPLPCMQRQAANFGSELFYYWPLLRNNNMAIKLRRFTWSYGGRNGRPQGPKRAFSSSWKLGPRTKVSSKVRSLFRLSDLVITTIVYLPLILTLHKSHV